MVYFLSDLLRVGPGLGVLLLDKLVTLLVTSVIGLVGLLALGKGWAAAAFAGVGLVGAAAGVILLVADDLRGRLGRLLMGRHREKLEGFASTVKAVLSQPSALIRNAGLTLARYGCGVSAMWMTFVAIGESVPVWVIALVTAIVTLVSVVPVSISGLGVREVSGTVMYVILAGLSAESAAAAMLIGSFRMYLTTGVAFVTGNAMSVTEEA